MKIRIGFAFITLFLFSTTTLSQVIVSRGGDPNDDTHSTEFGYYDNEDNFVFHGRKRIFHGEIDESNTKANLTSKTNLLSFRSEFEKYLSLEGRYVFEEENYSHGIQSKKHIIRTAWKFQKRLKVFEANYKEGQLHGLVTFYSPEENNNYVVIPARIYFEKGVRKWKKEYYKTGQLKSYQDYPAQGLKLYREYFKNGELKNIVCNSSNLTISTDNSKRDFNISFSGKTSTLEKKHKFLKTLTNSLLYDRPKLDPNNNNFCSNMQQAYFEQGSTKFSNICLSKWNEVKSAHLEVINSIKDKIKLHQSKINNYKDWSELKKWFYKEEIASTKKSLAADQKSLKLRRQIYNIDKVNLYDETCLSSESPETMITGLVRFDSFNRSYNLRDYDKKTLDALSDNEIIDFLKSEFSFGRCVLKVRKNYYNKFYIGDNLGEIASFGRGSKVRYAISDLRLFGFGLKRCFSF